ncbi:hypothetical protein GQ600_16271 [Phytophthora cactorum]|nr:hypothetical protein GQ600_16271 [Phytophthora cactorum]
MCRAGNTASIHSGHISWEQDSLTIRFGHMKNDQDGTRSRDARHIYANPFLPEICPIFSLAIYAAVFGLGNSKLYRYGAAGDRIVGRYVAGLPFEETGFEVLPPFFPDIDDSIHNAIHRCISNITSRLLRAGRFYLAR